MPDPHERSVASALKTVERLGKLTDRLRGKNSAVNRAYRTVLRALKGNTDNPAIVADAMATLEQSIRTAAADYYQDAINLGNDQARRDLRIFDLGEPDSPDPNSASTAIASTMSNVEAQSAKAVSVARSGLGEEYIIGDESRRGIVQPAPILTEMAFWLTGLSVLSYVAGTQRKAPGAVRQAVAQIDEHTTQTCLNVHGQIVGMKEDFHLTGTPRYADYMRNSPFHYGCRTAVAIILPKFVDPEVTKEMREDAIEQGKKPKPSTLKGRAHFRVVGKSVQQFRKGRWHTYERFKTNIAARTEAARLNEARRS